MTSLPHLTRRSILAGIPFLARTARASEPPESPDPRHPDPRAAEHEPSRGARTGERDDHDVRGVQRPR